MRPRGGLETFVRAELARCQEEPDRLPAKRAWRAGARWFACVRIRSRADGPAVGAGADATGEFWCARGA